VDRFMRGKIGHGILKFLTCCAPPVFLLLRFFKFNHSFLGRFYFFGRLFQFSVLGSVSGLIHSIRYFSWVLRARIVFSLPGLTICFSVLGCVWVLIDWIIALTKLGKYEKDFVFIDKKWG